MLRSDLPLILLLCGFFLAATPVALAQDDMLEAPVESAPAAEAPAQNSEINAVTGQAEQVENQPPDSHAGDTFKQGFIENLPPLEEDTTGLEAREMTEFPVVKLRALDKTTARTMTFEANVGSTVRFGAIYIKVQTCRKTPPVEQPEAAAFLQIWENPLNADPKWIYSGWMFSSSPGLAAMDHPIYDVWVLDCLEAKGGAVEEEILPEDKRHGEGELDEKAAPQEPVIEESH